MLPTKLGLFGQAVSESKNCLGIDQSASRAAAMFATNWAELNNIYRGHSIYASYQVSIHLTKLFQRFLEIDQTETITAYGYSVSEVNIF
jgi:hypothetical protein